MPIPWDPTQHIQNIGAGLQQAMPGIQAGIAQAQGANAGDAEYERFLNMFEQRINAGEDKQTVMADLLGQFQQFVGGQPQAYPNAQTSTQVVGIQGEQPAIGSPGTLQQPIAAPPNSFKPGISLTQAQQPPQQPAQVAPVQAPAPGINLRPTAPSAAQTPIAPESVGQPIGNSTEVAGGDYGTGSPVQKDLTSVNYEVPGATVSRDTPTEEKPLEYDSTESSPSVVNRQSMNTAINGSPPPRLPSRMEQENRMGRLEKMANMKTKLDTVDNKKEKSEQDNQIKILKALSSSKRLEAKDIGDLQAKIAGLDNKSQIAVTKLFIESKLAQERMKIQWAALQVKKELGKLSAAGAKLPPELKIAHDNYQKAASRLNSYKMSGDGDESTFGRLLIETENNLNAYNSVADSLNAAGGQFPKIDVPVMGPDAPTP